MPDCSSTSGPFDPSPGYGPAVSSGISQAAVAAARSWPGAGAAAGGEAGHRRTEPEDGQHGPAVDQGDEIEAESLVDDLIVGRANGRPS